jgi:uncharacterized membrane protein YphA (DoxX/SURF4 family)/thiol-disulfide isomerase/thioredoxin
MNSIKKYAPWTIRILISFVFFLSAIAKLYPNPSYALTYFEVHQLEPMGIPLSVAQYLSRILIGVEFAIGFLLLLPFFLKRVVIPVTIFMLTVFIVELGIEIIFKGNAGNCGCFGTLIKMTPLEAMLKNVVSIGLLVWYYFLTKSTATSDALIDQTGQVNSKEGLFGTLQARLNWSIIGNLLLASIFGVFIAGPIRFQQAEPAKPVTVIDTLAVEPIHTHDTSLVTDPKPIKKDSIVPKVDLGPSAKSSGFENIFPDINKDKKILCFFAPGCDHCRATAKALTAMKSTVKDFPSMRIIFMDEEPEVIPDFFKFAGAEYPYYVMDIVSFWKKLGSGKEVPGVLYLWNGNSKKFYQGIDKEEFNAAEFKKILNKKS